MFHLYETIEAKFQHLDTYYDEAQAVFQTVAMWPEYDYSPVCTLWKGDDLAELVATFTPTEYGLVVVWYNGKVESYKNLRYVRDGDGQVTATEFTVNGLEGRITHSW